MKKILLLIPFFALLSFIQQEQYYITFIKGIVLVERTGKQVKIGETLLPSDKLIFKNSTDKLACISPGKGRFEISPIKSSNNSRGELIAVLKNILLPLSNTYHLSTRSLLFNGYDPKTYFNCEETQNRILLLTDQALPLLSSYHPDPNNFFFVQYTEEGKTIVRKIVHSEKGLLFSNSLFMEGNVIRIPNKAMICYQEKDASGSHSSVLAEIIPVLSSASEIRQQISLITKYSSSTDTKKLNAEIMAHIYDNYGKIGSEEITILSKQQ